MKATVLFLLPLLLAGLQPWEMAPVPHTEAYNHALPCFNYKGIKVFQYKTDCPTKKEFGAAIERFKKKMGADHKVLTKKVTFLGQPISVDGWSGSFPQSWIAGLWDPDGGILVFAQGDSRWETLGHEFCHGLLDYAMDDAILLHSLPTFQAVCELDTDDPLLEGTVWEGQFRE
jgi:hypothetical protein